MDIKNITRRGTLINPIAPPRFLFIETTTECNLRCKQCHMWMSTEPNTTLSTDEKLRLIHELAAWSPHATVVLTGGETMKKREEFFAITELCRKKNLFSAANTNATLMNENEAEILLKKGPTYLVISLDSHRPELHDWIRGRRGTHEKVVKAIKTLSQQKQLFETNTKIITNTILFDRNIREIDQCVDFAKSLGVDGMMFQVLSRTFLLSTEKDIFFDRHFPRYLVQFNNSIDRLIAMKKESYPIITSENDFEWMKLYIENPDFLGEQVCGSGEKNMMVDQHGDVQLCFSMRSLMKGRSLGNIRATSLRSLWESDSASEARKAMAVCRKNCGMLNCHRKDVT